jgi:predicted kinase
MRGVIIMRGLPGSGKSTLAEKLAEGQNSVVLAADDFMKNGYDPNLVYAAHMWCRRRFEESLQARIDLVIVANTNTTKAEIQPYMDKAAEYGYEAVIVEVECDIETSVTRNIHGAPLEKVQEMARCMKASPLDPSWKLLRVSRQG